MKSEFVVFKSLMKCSPTGSWWCRFWKGKNANKFVI